MLLECWDRLKEIPGGRSLFNWGFWLKVPYSGSVRPEILELEPGHAKVRLRDRRAVRNHLHSIHAAALMNLAEAASGLAFISGLSPKMKAIVIRFSIEYLKKARGTLIAECHCTPPTAQEKQEFSVEAVVKNYQDEIVAKATAVWLVAPK